MRISRRTSGGRGEYEISGTLQGRRAADLEGCLLSLDFPNGLLIHTRIRVVKQGGKLRLRLDGANIHIQRQVAATFMMPDPARETRVLGAGEPVLQEGAYAIEHIEVDKMVLAAPGSAVLTVSKITCVNQSHLGEEIDLRNRAALLQEVWNKRREFTDDIASKIGEHETLIRGGHINSPAEALVGQIQRTVSERSADIGIVYSARGDVLPKLGEALNYQVPQPLLSIESVDPEDIELKKRTAKEWKRWANARGPASARFKQDVRRAYQATCVICGAHYPPTPYNSAGVDAAHILPWSDYELDEIFNGLCLCKIHHWAFDEAVICINHTNGKYVSEIPEEAEDAIRASDPLFSLDALRRDLGIIPAERLPKDRRLWPRPELLAKLSEIY
jgi:hypothetical protein